MAEVFMVKGLIAYKFTFPSIRFDGEYVSLKSIAPAVYCPIFTKRIGVMLTTDSNIVMTVTTKKTVKIPIFKLEDFRYCSATM